MSYLSSIPWTNPQVIAAILAALLPILIPDVRSLLIGFFKAIGGRIADAVAPSLASASRAEAKELGWVGVKQVTSNGVYYKADSEPRPDVLVVMIHGVLGNAAGSWANLPELLQAHVNGWPGKPLDAPGRDAVDSAPVRFDVLCFEYPAGLFSHASIALGAEHLRETLREQKHYRHFLFVTHSTGGLVLKKALIDDMREFRDKLSEKALPIESVMEQACVGRTRQVVNFAVPHTGGSFPYSLLLFPLYGLIGVLLVGFWLPHLLLSRLKKPKPGFDYGLNRIGWELRHRRFRGEKNALLELEKEYRREVEGFDRDILPRPASVEVTGRSDPVIDKPVNDVIGQAAGQDRKTKTADLALLFRGTHPTVKEARQPDDHVVQFLGGFLKRYSQPYDVALADATVRRVLELDRHCRLIGAEPLRRPAYSTWVTGRDVRGHVITLQAEVFRMLHEEAPRGRPDTPLFIVTGDVGTGKTVTLQRFALSLATSFLNSPVETQTLPVFFPLHMISGVRAANLPSTLIAEWHHLANKRYLDGIELPPDWLEARWKAHRTVVILDSVDEFLLNHRGLTREQFRAAVNEFQNASRGSGLVSLVGGIRWGEPILESLEDDALLVLHVRWLSLVEACRYFPRAKRVIESVLVVELSGHGNAVGLAPEAIQACVSEVIEELLGGAQSAESREHPELRREIASLISKDQELRPDQQALSVVRTPLVLSELEADDTTDPESEPVSMTAYRFPHQVLDRALIANIKKSRLHLERLADGGELRIKDWKSALSLVAMAYSVRYAPAMTLEEVQAAVAGRESIWEEHAWPEGSDADRDELTKGRAIIRDARLLGVLLDKTVFYPLGRRRYFKHREWYDFLLGRYFAMAFRSENLKEVCASSFTTRAHLFGGNVLVERGFSVTERYARRIVNQMTQEWGHLLLGNLGALISKSPIPIRPEAVDLLFSEENESKMTHGGKFVLLAGLGYRLLRGNPQADPGQESIARNLIRIFQRDLRHAWDRPEALDGVQRLHASVAYCYLKRMGKLPDGAGRDWPGFDLTPQQEREIVHRLHNELRDGKFQEEEELSPIYKTCQTAFLTVQLEEYNYANRQISLAHYLYTLCLARKHGAAIEFVRENLPLVLSDAHPLGDVLRTTENGVPVRSIYETCRQSAEAAM